MKLRDAIKRAMHEAARALYWGSGAFKDDPKIEEGVNAAWLDGFVRGNPLYADAAKRVDEARARGKMS